MVLISLSYKSFNKLWVRESERFAQGHPASVFMLEDKPRSPDFKAYFLNHTFLLLFSLLCGCELMLKYVLFILYLFGHLISVIKPTSEFF